jgi:hypothetical protein
VAPEPPSESRAAYGKKCQYDLLNVLTTEFGSGFSVTNLEPMWQFHVLNAQRMSQTASDLFQTPKGAMGQAPSNQLTASEKRLRVIEVRK